MQDKFNKWWDEAGYTCKDEAKYKDMEKAWNEGRISIKNRIIDGDISYEVISNDLYLVSKIKCPNSSATKLLLSMMDDE